MNVHISMDGKSGKVTVKPIKSKKMNATQQKFKSILFSTEMVQAILAGRKTQTRRVLADWDQHKPKFIISQQGMYADKYPKPSKYMAHFRYPEESTDSVGLVAPIQPGDILWVRESATVYKIEAKTGFHYSGKEPVGFKSIQKIGIEYCDGERVVFDYPERLSLNIDCGKKLAYGIFKEAARIFLKVTDVRVERLQDISEEDAIAEGVMQHSDYGSTGYIHYGRREEALTDIDAVWSFQTLWQSINAKKHPWESNPWVWVYTFKRIEKPQNFLS